MVIKTQQLRRIQSAANVCLGTILALTTFGSGCYAQTPPPSATGIVPSVPISAPTPPMTIDAGDQQISGTPKTFTKSGQFTLTGGVTVAGGSEFILRADTITGDMTKGVATAVGHVYFRELNSYIDMDSIFASRDRTTDAQDNQDLWSGIAQNVLVRSYPYTIVAQKLVFQNDLAHQSNEIDLYSGVLTTSPPDQKSEYSIHAGEIKYEPTRHRVTIYNGAFFVGKTRLFEFKKLTRRTGTLSGGAAGGDKLFNESFGYTGFNGPYIGYSKAFGVPNHGVTAALTIPLKHDIGVLITGRTQVIVPKSNRPESSPPSILGRIRQAVESTQPILPEGDPLLFHWFQASSTMEDRFETIPNTLSVDAVGIVSYQERVYGHETDDLFYSRLPEASLIATAPISGPRALPTSHDPAQIRQALHQIALYAVITPTVGRYTENPDNITADRDAVQLNIESRPILVGNNLLFKPLVSYHDATYPEKHLAFQVFQYDFALEKYVTDETGYGIEYLDSQEHGTSPFQFDTPYTTKEFDLRLQRGFKKMIIGVVLKDDLNHNNIYEEQIMIAPIMRSLIPRFAYDFRDSTFSVGVDIKGLTY